MVENVIVWQANKKLAEQTAEQNIYFIDIDTTAMFFVNVDANIPVYVGNS